MRNLITLNKVIIFSFCIFVTIFLASGIQGYNPFWGTGEKIIEKSDTKRKIEKKQQGETQQQQDESNGNNNNVSITYYIEGNIVGGPGLIKITNYVYGQYTSSGKTHTTLLASDKDVAGALLGTNVWQITYITNTIGQHIINGLPNMIYFVANSTNDYYLAFTPNNSSCTLNVTSYGSVGGVIEGTFWGTVTHYTNGNMEGNYNLTGGSFKVPRIVDK